MAVIGGPMGLNAGFYRIDHPLVMSRRPLSSPRKAGHPVSLERTYAAATVEINGQETVTAGSLQPDPRLARGGRARSRVQSPHRDKLYCTLHRARVHHTLPDHRPA